MSYESPKGDKVFVEKQLVPVMPIVPGEGDAALDLVKKFPEAIAYGMLLLGDPKCAMATLVRERWSEIHNLTGDRFVLFVLERPAEWTDSYLRYWRGKLGDDFKRTWKQWQGKEEPGAAYPYLSLFHPALKPSQLPCLVLFTDAKKREVVVRPIPDWDQESLFKLLQGIAEAVQESADQPQAERLEWLRSELTSPSARFRAAAGHVSALAVDYCKAHPASVASTAVSAALAMSGAGLLTIPAASLAMLSVLKDMLPGAKSE